MKVFFSSDQHFGHKNVIRLCNRPFPDLHMMHKAMTENWNSVVSPGDLVYVVGDFSFSNMKDTKAYLDHLNGRKILIKGNHDKGGEIGYLTAGFELVLQRAQIRIFGRYVNLSHYPYLNDPGEQQDADHKGYEVRYKELRMKDDGHWLIHGHIHGTWKTKNKMINVGVDVWNFTPVSIQVIESMIALAEKDTNEIPGDS